MMGRRPVVFPGMGHTLMLEPGWDGVAAAVHGWLAATLPAREASDRPAASAAPVRPG
jgi:hypothetical protein